MVINMNDEELVLSDIHLEKIVGDSKEKICLSRFRFCLSFVQNEKESQTVEVLRDEDGDIVRPAASTHDRDVVKIYHSMATTLPKVGLQVWRGSFLLCDYIIHKRDMFYSKHILELGSGTGLVGIVAGQFANTVICTDVGNDVINLCRRNVKENGRLSRSPSTVNVRVLDWLSDIPLDLEHQPEIVLTSDCIYDNRLTDALFNTLRKILNHCRDSCCKGQPQILIALEKRLNFTTDVYDVTCHEYDHFRACLKEFETDCSLKINKCDVADIPMYFEYDRTKYVELWEIG